MKDLLVILGILILCFDVSSSAGKLASALPQEKERRSTTPQTHRDETEKRTGLPLLHERKGSIGIIQTRNTHGLELAERSRRSNKENIHPRSFLSELRL